MQPTLCSRCKKNVAVIFVTRMDQNSSDNQGYCLKCARELKIKPVEDMMNRMGISDEDLDNLTSEMMNAFGGAEGLESLLSGQMGGNETEDDEDDEGKTATFPFLNKLFGAGNNPDFSKTT